MELMLAEREKWGKNLLIAAQIDKAASNSQVYRIAMSWYEKGKASDLTKSEVANVATVWFGYLGFTVSTMGIFLAFGGMRLLRDKE